MELTYSGQNLITAASGIQCNNGKAQSTMEYFRLSSSVFKSTKKCKRMNLYCFYCIQFNGHTEERNLKRS